MGEREMIEAANNPPPIAQAIQMPLGSAADLPWVNRVLNAYRKTRHPASLPVTATSTGRPASLSEPKDDSHE